MLQRFLESDFEFYKLDVSRYCLERKINRINSPFLNFFRLSAYFFFKFSNIINIDLFNVHRFMLVFWLFTGSWGSIVKFKVNLRLGIYYYHFFIKYKIEKRKFFLVISFLLEEFLNQQYWDCTYFFDNNFILFFRNLDVLTNYKLARGVYFYRIKQKFFFKINFEGSFFLFNMILNSLKLHVK